MQAKTMIQTIAATLILTAAASWGSMIWNFDDGTAQGWLQTGGSAAYTNTWNSSPTIFTQVENGGGATGSLYITGLSQTITQPSDFVRFSTLLTNSYVDRTPYNLMMTTNKGTYDYQIDNGGINGGSTTMNKQLNLFTDLSKGGSSPVLAVGDVVTGLSFHDFGFSFSMYADNISLVVPEPASLALLALGGCCLLRRRR